MKLQLIGMTRIKSTDDYEGWKRETKEIYLEIFPRKEKQINEFMSFISERYDKHQRVYLPRKVMWYLYHKRKEIVKGNSHFWIAFIGRKGGEGKSMLADHIFYFLDGSYDKSRVHDSYMAFLKGIIQIKKKEKREYPAIVLDEPENKTHSLSVKGRSIRDVLERIRILHLFVGTCANSLTSVAPFIYERLTTVIFINNKHRFWLWDNDRDKPRYSVIDDIKGSMGWAKFRHGVFKRREFVKRCYFKNLGFSKDNPFDWTPYEKKKKDNVIGEIEGMLDDKPKREARINKLDYTVIDPLIVSGMKQAEIARKVNCSRPTIHERVKMLVKLGKIPPYKGGVKV